MSRSDSIFPFYFFDPLTSIFTDVFRQSNKMIYVLLISVNSFGRKNEWDETELTNRKYSMT